MNQTMQGILLILAEAGAVLLVLGATLLVVGILRRRATRRASRALIQRFQSKAGGRKLELAAMLTNGLDMDEAVAEPRARQLVNRQTRVYQRILEIVNGGQHRQLPELDTDVDALTCFYRKVVEEQARTIKDERDTLRREKRELARDLAATREQLETLARDRDRLEQRLKEALETVDEVMGEYTRLYEAKFGERASYQEMTASLRRRQAEAETGSGGPAEPEPEAEEPGAGQDTAPEGGTTPPGPAPAMGQGGG